MLVATGLRKASLPWAIACGRIMLMFTALHGQLVVNSNGSTNSPSLPALPPPIVHRIYPYQLEVGDSREKVEDAFMDAQLVNTSAFKKRYADIVGNWDAKDSVVWLLPVSDLDIVLESDKRERYMIVFFDAKGALEDLLSFCPGRRERTVPYVRGIYDKGLQSLEVGMSMQEVSSTVGDVSPVRYVRSLEGSWVVEFMYFGTGGSTWMLTVDAATGIIKKIVVSGV